MRNFDRWVRSFWRVEAACPVTMFMRIAAVMATATAYVFVGALAWAILTMAFLAGR